MRENIAFYSRSVSFSSISRGNRTFRSKMWERIYENSQYLSLFSQGQVSVSEKSISLARNLLDGLDIVVESQFHWGSSDLKGKSGKLINSKKKRTFNFLRALGFLLRSCYREDYIRSSCEV